MDEALLWCASGPGILREESWTDEDGDIARYNLAFINHFMTSKDNGRVLGYGTVQEISITSYNSLATMFRDEVSKRRTEAR